MSKNVAIIMTKLPVQVVILTLFMIFITTAASLAQEALWDHYEGWENHTAYTRTYVVDRNHPGASDENEGTAEAPLKTINRAAQLVQAGERVLIFGGVYRELIEPQNGGTAADDMVSYEAAPGEEVIVKGSRVVASDWVQRSVYTDVLPDSSLQFTWSKKLWMTTFPDSLFEEGYYPFRLPNILPEEYTLMPWAQLVRSRVPYTSTRGMLWQDGRRLVQLEEYGDLLDLPGSFWVDSDGKTVHVHPYGGGHPSQYLFEVGVQSHLFRPQQLGLGYIQVRGITFTHCPNGFLRTSTGAVTTRGGHHWIIEDNDISEVNSAGLEFGYYAFEFRDPVPENIQPRTDPDVGGVIVRNNRISEAGTAGIRSYTVTNGIIEKNTIWNVGWQDAQNYWECSGIKLLRTRHTVVRDNHIYNITGGNGIWMDWDIRDSRVTGNVIHDVQTVQGGIFVEAAQVPNLVDNNVIVNIDGSGIYVNDSDSTLIYHNLVARTTGPVVTARVATQRQLNGRWLTAKDNRVFNNLFIDGGHPVRFESDQNEMGHNLYVTSMEPVRPDLSRDRKGADQASAAMRGAFLFNAQSGFIYWDVADTPEPVPALPEVTRDFFQVAMPAGSAFPGPFSTLPQTMNMLLNEQASW